MRKKVVIVGAGALGSHLAVLLRNHADLKVVDFDRVESKNVLSQFHDRGSVGKNKALSLQKTIRFLWGTTVEAVPHRLEIGNIKEILSGADLVVDCVDNGETRRVIQGYCVVNSLPCLHGALAADGMFGQVTWSERFKADDAAPGAATCEDGEQLPFIAMASSVMAQTVKEFLSAGTRRSSILFPAGARQV